MTQTKSKQAGVSSSINLSEVIEDLFMVLTTKEKEVIVKRFSLDNQPKQTLEKIGQHFSVTRERIRQIEKIALNKLRRTVFNTKLRAINAMAVEIVTKRGGVMTEDALVNEVLAQIGSGSPIDAHIVRLALTINGDISKVEKSNIYKPFWIKNGVELGNIRAVMSQALDVLKKTGDVMRTEKLVNDINIALSAQGQQMMPSFIAASLEVDKRIKRIENGYGLMTWRHVNPRSIRDKAYIVLKKRQKPMHFVDIAKEIIDAGFDKKVVTTQAVHNELIRYDQFVLVGRGLPLREMQLTVPAHPPN